MVRLRGSILAGYIDPVCKNASCHFVRDTETAFGIEAYDYRCTLDTEVLVSDEGETRHCVSGWGEAHYWGVWSDGPEAILYLDLIGAFERAYRLHFLCRGAGHALSPIRTVQVLVNGQKITIWQFLYPHETDHSVWKVLDVPAEVFTNGRIEVRFLIDEPVSPQTWGINYGRLIGIGLSAFKVTAV